jgi:hypothetical protein
VTYAPACKIMPPFSRLARIVCSHLNLWWVGKRGPMPNQRAYLHGGHPQPSGREDGLLAPRRHTLHGRSRSAEAKPTRRWSMDQDQGSYTNHNQPTNSSGLSSTLTLAGSSNLFISLLFYFQIASFAYSIVHTSTRRHDPGARMR